jgi:6-phosphogluconolactonase
MPEVFADKAALADAATEAIAGLLRRALAERGRASLVGTGGTSPGPVYDRLSQTDHDWAHVAVTL